MDVEAFSRILAVFLHFFINLRSSYHDLVFVVHFVGDFRASGNLSLGVKVSLCSPFFTLILKFANFTPVLVKSH